MAYTPTTVVGSELADSLQWLQGDDTLVWYLDAIGALFQQAAEIVVDQGTDGEIVDGDFPYQTGFGSLFTPNERFPGDTAICPVEQLPYLAQFVGVSIPPAADDVTARSLITSEAGQRRGTPSAIVAAAQRFLIGTQSVVNIERMRPDGTASGYWFVLVVRSDEISTGVRWDGATYPWSNALYTWTNGDNVAALIAAVDAVKPGGVMWSLVVSDGTTWTEASGTWAASTLTWQQTANA